MTRKHALTHADAGVTLIELMVVMAIVVSLAIVAGRAMTRQDNAGAAAVYSHKIWAAFRQARLTAVSSGAVTRVTIASNGKSLTITRASLLGPGPPAGTNWISLSLEETSGNVFVQAVASSAVVTENLSPGTGGLPATIDFAPDGSATASTVYLRDEGNLYHYKVVLYGLTGYSHQFNKW